LREKLLAQAVDLAVGMFAEIFRGEFQRFGGFSEIVRQLLYGMAARELLRIQLVRE